MAAAANLTDVRFGKLVCIRRVPSTNSHARWLCLCDCGKSHEASATSLKCGYVSHCGCSPKRFKHGFAKSRLESVLSDMVQRCTNPKNDEYHNYGGRGISVCDEWLSDHLSFYTWCLANGYDDDLQIDRIDNDGNYEPGNCRFVTPSENQRNKRNNHRVYFEGRSVTLKELSSLLGINDSTLRKRISRGHPLHSAISSERVDLRRVRKELNR